MPSLILSDFVGYISFFIFCPYLGDSRVRILLFKASLSITSYLRNVIVHAIMWIGRWYQYSSRLIVNAEGNEIR